MHVHLEHKNHNEKYLVKLSRRQIDCVILLARGMSDFEIGRVLDIRPDTVKEYIKAARKRYGVKRRPQLVFAAMQDGYL